MKILLTGSSGFVGRSLINLMTNTDKYQNIYALNRNFSHTLPIEVHQLVATSENVFLTPIPVDIDVIVHLAGRAHILNDNVQNPLEHFRSVNVQGTLQLAQQALENKVKRFIFISSIGVNGALTTEKPFDETNQPHPHADYAISKLEAEQALKELFKDTNTELVIIRPPLVYAADAPGNFARLLKLAATNVPLPFAYLNNKRSFIALENLVSFIEMCIEHPQAKNELFLIADNEVFSTQQLVSLIRKGMGQKKNLVYVPQFLMKIGAICIGKAKLYEQLFLSLEVDASKARQLLNWEPPINGNDALEKAGKIYLERSE